VETEGSRTVTNPESGREFTGTLTKANKLILRKILQIKKCDNTWTVIL
jgi:hypothetical protein